MKSAKVQFKNHSGLMLAAQLELPARRQPLAFAIFAHCFTCNKNLRAIRNVSIGLTSIGIAVLRFDFTGLGESEGEFSNSNFSSSVEDLISASDFLKNNYKSPSVIIGHSLGGTAALLAASRLTSIQAIVTIGAPANPLHVKGLFRSKVPDILKHGKAEVHIGGRPFYIKEQFLRDIENKEVDKVIKGLRRPLLIFHSPQDEVVSILNAAEIYQSAHHPKSFISLNGADHLLTNKMDSLYIGKVIGSWLDRYISLPESRPPRTDRQVVAKITHGYTTEMVSGNHFFIADEPEEVGGNDFGPSPYDFLSASLAACTAMTIKMYANRKEMNLEDVEVHVDHQKEYPDPTDGAKVANQRIDHFQREILLNGNLSEVQRKRLLEIANKCPVHRTLEGEIVISTSLKE